MIEEILSQLKDGYGIKEDSTIAISIRLAFEKPQKDNTKLKKRIKELEKERHDHLQCEECDWEGLESELIGEPLTEGRNHSEYALCPKCKTDFS